MTDQPRKSFAEMRRELAAQRGRQIDSEPKPERALKSVQKVDDDLIPDVLGDRSEEDLEIDSIIDSIDVLDAYRRWIGKEVNEKTTGQREGVKVSCPNPGHRDSDPSAWLNLDKKTWFCGGCQEGGDVYDLAAIKFGYPRPDYKEGKTFHELRQEMAESYGYRFKTVAGTEIIWREDDGAGGTSASDSDAGESDRELAGREGSEASEPGAGSVSGGSEPDHEGAEEKEATVTHLRAEDVPDDEEEEILYPTIDWRKMVPEDTFLWSYMSECSKDDSPEEYHFWHGLLALAHAVGRNVFLDDLKFVYGNMLVCLLGGTGYGKSRSRYWLEEVLEEAVPFQDTGLDTTGCKQVPVPASGENLIAQFQHIAIDPALPKGGPVVRTPVNGIVDYDEFAGLLSRAMRQGSTLKPYVQAFADSKRKISSSSNTGGTFEAYQPFCSITASTQPKAVRALLSKYDAGSGFLNRWVFVGGQRKKRESIGGKRSSIHVDLDEPIELLKKVRAWGSMEREVVMDDDGYEAWDKWFHKEIEPMQLKDETDLLPRIGLTMKRLLLLFAINEKRTVVGKEDVEKIKPLFEYLVSCYGIINAEIGITQMTEITQEILRHIQRLQEQTGRGATARELGQRLKRKNYSPDLIKKALETLVALDWVDIDKSKGPGRPSIRYKVVG